MPKTEPLPVFHYGLDEIDKAAEFVLAHIRSKIILLDAPMGAGKTTLASALIKRLTGETFLGSPTFAIVQPYTTREGSPLYHFDLYRLHSVEELSDIGFEEYVSPETWILIEWPALAEAFLPEDFDRVQIETGSDGNRILKISHNE